MEERKETRGRKPAPTDVNGMAVDFAISKFVDDVLTDDAIKAVGGHEGMGLEDWIDGGADSKLAKLGCRILSDVRSLLAVVMTPAQANALYKALDADTVAKILIKLGVFRKDVFTNALMYRCSDSETGIWRPVTKEDWGKVGLAMLTLNSKAGAVAFRKAVEFGAYSRLVAEAPSWYEEEAVLDNGVYDQRHDKFYPWGCEHLASRYYRRKARTAFFREAKELVAHWKEQGLPEDWNDVRIEKSTHHDLPTLIIEAYGETWDALEWLYDLFVRDTDASFLAVLYGMQFMLREGGNGFMMLLLNLEGEARGNNGKSTLLYLLQCMLGIVNCSALMINEFGGEGNNFKAQKLTNVIANICSEADGVNQVIAYTAVLKAMITHDYISSDVKFVNDDCKFQYHGTFWQALNGLPTIKDETESLARRLICLDFERCYTGSEKSYIKKDFMASPVVCEYFVWLVLTQLPYTEQFPEEVISGLAKFNNEVSISRDPVKSFLRDHVDGQLTENIFPAQTIYDAYTAYCEQEFGKNCKPLGRNKFYTKLQAYLRDNAESLPYILVKGKAKTIPCELNNFLPQMVIAMTKPSQGWRPSEANRVQNEYEAEELRECDCISGNEHRSYMKPDGVPFLMNEWGKPWESNWGKKCSTYLLRTKPIGLDADGKARMISDYPVSDTDIQNYRYVGCKLTDEEIRNTLAIKGWGTRYKITSKVATHILEGCMEYHGNGKIVFTDTKKGE